MSVVVGNAEERKAALAKQADLYVINREMVLWLVEQSGYKFDFDTIVIDELSSFKNHQSKRFKALMKVRPKVKRIIALTGTPSSNGLMDLWAEFRLLDMGERLGRYITQYRTKYFMPDKRNAQIIFSYKLLPGAEEQIYDKISDITISMKAADFLPMPERIESEYPVYLSEEEREKYDVLKQEMVLQLPGEEITAANAAALSGKLSQLANGAIYTEEKEVITVHDRKLDALEDIIEAAAGKPILVAYWFQHDLHRITERLEALNRYLATKTGIKPNTQMNYNFVRNLMKNEPFSRKKISEVKVSDAKLFLIKLQQDGKGYSTVKTVRGVLRPAFQMAVDDDLIIKNPFGFQLAGVVVNDSVTREAIKPDQMRKFLKFVHDDNVYCKYYEVVYILFHTGMRISEFCGLTIRDLDMENRIINIDHQLQRIGMTIHIESTKTNAGTRKIPMTEDVYRCFQGILEDRETPTVEKIVDGYSGFLFLDKEGLPEVAMHWEHRFNHMVKRYNEIYRVQIPNITPHVCRHTYCSNMARAGMNPKTLQYLMGHSDIGVTMNTYTHLGLEDAQNEMVRLEELNRAKEEVAKAAGEKKPLTQRSFRAV